MAVFSPESRGPLSQSPTAEVLIGLGANVPGPAGGPAQTLAAAIEALRGVLAIARVSRALANPAYPEGAGPDFLNLALIGHTDLPPAGLLQALLEVERRLGRVRERVWEARPIDIDLLNYADLVTAGFWLAAARGDVPPDPPAFILPHPRLHYRHFVAGPIAEIAPAWRHPALGLTTAALAERLSRETP